MAKNKTNKKVGQRKCSYHSEECLAAPETMDIEEVEEEMVGSEEELWDIIEVIHGKTDRVCHMEGCNLLAVAVWKSNLVNDPNDVWPMCESCQENYYGGWPDDIERPATFIEEGLASAAGDELENNKAASNVATKDEAEPTNDAIRGETVDDFITSDVVDANKEPTSESEDEANSDENEADEVWDVKKIMSIAAINHECPIKCSHETCDLPAAVAMVSNVKPNENWYSCLDCQVCSTILV